MAKISIVKENKAKFKVFITDKDYKAKEDGLWYIEEKEKSGYTKIAYVDKEHKADFTIFFVDKDYKAKWRTASKFKGRL